MKFFCFVLFLKMYSCKFLCYWILQTIIASLSHDENCLGFSIAGGRGSTPYKGDDKVSVVSLVLYLFSFISWV